jgi:OOP family OmpA-OmpF porin
LVSGLANVDVSSIVIAGYTDSVGAAKYNLALSVRRAEAVRNYLVEKGVNTSLITVEGYGEENPVASNKTKEGRAKNRRVDISIFGTEQR